ncbi:MAG: sugar transferase [Paludibacteraceae bacterium]|nr:sugar transferase [Paludibacteraceae bacterium]
MILKQLFDRIVSLIALLFLSWLLLVIALAIKIKMKGPVFFVQNRVGKDGVLFKIHKFRTMVVDHHGSSVSLVGESRITPFGAVLRNYKLDELPELWDVLIGKMSFVGPRPDVPGYADKLQGEERNILKLLPGITGPASLKYRNEEVLLSTKENPLQYNDEVIFPDKVRLNLYYYRHYSFWMDLKIIWATIFHRHLLYAGELI